MVFGEDVACYHYTTAAAEDRTVRHVVLEHLVWIARIQRTELTAVDIDIGATAVGSDGGIASLAVANEVTLTHGTQVTAAEHVTYHVTAVDVNMGVTINLTYSVGVLAIEFALTFTATIDGMAHEALGEGDAGAIVDVAVLTATIHGTGDTGITH